MASASTSPLPLSPTFSFTQFQWPSSPHLNRLNLPLPLSQCHQHSDQPHHSASLFDLPSFDQSTHSTGFVDATGLTSSESSNVDGEAEGASLYSTAAPAFPARLSPSLSSLSSPSSPSLYPSTPSPPAVSQPFHQHPYSTNATTAGGQRTVGRRRRRKVEDVDEAEESDKEAAEQQHSADSHSSHNDDLATSDHTNRRLKHRQIDAVRRAREQSAISRLLALTERLTHIPHFDQQHCSTAKRRRAAGSESSKKDKVSVLEEAADRMDALYGLIEQLGSACAAQYEHSRARVYQQKPLPTKLGTSHVHALSLIPTNTPSSCHLPCDCSHSTPFAHFNHSQPFYNSGVERQSLYSTFFLSAPLPMAAIRCDTGQVMDVNTAALSLGGWQPHHIIGRRISSPYEIIMAARGEPQSQWLTREAALYAVERERVLVDDDDGGMTGARLHPQYESSLQAERALYAGEESIVQAVWRLPKRDGRLHEVATTQWCGGWMDVPDDEGGMTRRPTYMIYVIRPETITRID